MVFSTVRSLSGFRLLLTVMATIIVSESFSQKHIEIIRQSESKTFKEVVTETERYYKDKEKGKGSGYKQFKRWEYFHRQILADDDNVVDFSFRQYERLKATKRDRAAGRIGGTPTAGNWKPAGPLTHDNPNYNGRINTIVVDPANPKYIYAGSPAGGLWRTTDDGLTWKCLTDNIFSFMGITSIVIDPLSPSENRTLYILTGDKDGTDTNYMGIFKSVDNGTTWTNIPYTWPSYSSFSKLMLHPVDNKLLFLINDEGVFQYKVGVSSAWERKLAGNFTDMEFNPGSSATIYVSGPSGTYRSLDTGNIWTKNTSPIPASERIELAVTPSYPALVYLFVGQYGVASLYKSVDSGKTFTKVEAPYFDFNQVGYGQWRYDLAITISPDDPRTIFIGGINLYRSSDSGVSWQGEDMGHVDFHSLDFYHGYLYAGNDGGITRKKPSDVSYGGWDDLSQNFSVSQIYRLGVDQTSTDHILAGFQDNGTASIRNQHGKIFTLADGMECFVDPVDGDTWFSSMQTGVLYRGSGSTGEYQEISPPQGLRNWLAPYKMDPGNRMVIYAGYAELWKNIQQGNGQWVNITNGMTGLDEPIDDFTIAPSNSNWIYVIKANSVHRTTDGGKSWTRLTNPVLAYINSIIAHPQQPNVVWATKPYSNSGNRDPRIIKSTDGGLTWTDVSGTLPFVRATCLVYQNGSANGIYLGTDQGVYYKDDTMPDWIAFDYGIPYSPITDLEINYKSRKLYAATYGRGAWMTDLYGDSGTDTSTSVAIKREVWTGIAGTDVSSIPVNTTPATISDLTIFESPSNTGSDYGSRIRGYVTAPQSGNYIFWISSDDKSELWLSTDQDPVHKVKIASVTGYTSVRQWNKYATQQSQAIPLVANRKYYIEALHKEGTGSDHLAVGWQLPDGTLERPIPGSRLSPFGVDQNQPPVVSFSSPQDGESIESIEMTLRANASDPDGTIHKVEFYDDENKLGEDFSSPYEYYWYGISEGIHYLRVKAFDNNGASSESSIVVYGTIYGYCQGSGSIRREVWTGIPGTSVSSIPLNTPPSSVEMLPLFESPSNVGTDYGSRVHGYICAPANGYYTFWISSDDRSELWLTYPDPFSRTLIASVNGYTSKRQWDKYASQQSEPIYLEGGNTYYIEALHKEASGADHLAVGWQRPDGTQERPIPGKWLTPYEPPVENNPPEVSFTRPSAGQTFIAPATIELEANAFDADGAVSAVSFFNGDIHLEEDNTEPFSFTWQNVPPGTYTITAIATDDTDNVSEEATIVITVQAACVAAGNISYEQWFDVPGTNVSAIPLTTTPSATGSRMIFEMPSNTGSNFGTRVSGYLCAPATGQYVFWIASDDNSELWLSSDNTRGKKVKIASVTGHTDAREWTLYPSQTSAPIALEAGKKYYIEALHKEGSGVDHLAVGWKLPNGSLERPIPGSRLSPFNVVPAAAWQYAEPTEAEPPQNGFTVFPNPYRNGILTLAIPTEETGGSNNTSTTRVNIVSGSGQVVLSKDFACDTDCGTLEITVDDRLSPGIYMIEAILNRKRYMRKLMVN